MNRVTLLIVLAGVILVSGCSKTTYIKNPGETSGSVQADIVGPDATAALRTVVVAENQRQWFSGVYASGGYYCQGMIPRSAYPNGQCPQNGAATTINNVIVVGSGESVTTNGTRQQVGSQQQGREGSGATTAPVSGSGASARDPRVDNLINRVGEISQGVQRNADEIQRVEQESNLGDKQISEFTAQMMEQYYKELERRTNP